jgi:hypothetical protein
MRLLVKVKAHNQEGEESLKEQAEIILGQQVKEKKNIFQGVVARVSNMRDASDIFQSIKAHPRFRKCDFFPRAFRIHSPANAPSDDADIDEEIDRLKESPENKGTLRRHNGIDEYEADHRLSGVGDKLLHLLQRWEVLNVLLVVTRADNSLSQLLIGTEMYALAIEAAKLALEQYYIKTLGPVEAAKMELAIDDQSRAKPAPPPTNAKILNTCMFTTDVLPEANNFKARCDNDFKKPSEMNFSIEKSIDWLGITREEYDVLKKIHVATRELHLLFVCIAILLNYKVTADFTWKKCREILQVNKQLGTKLRHVQALNLSKTQVQAIRAIFQEPTFTYATIMRTSIAGAKIYTWIQKLLNEYDELELGLKDQNEMIISPSAQVSLTQSPTLTPSLSPAPSPAPIPLPSPAKMASVQSTKAFHSKKKNSNKSNTNYTTAKLPSLSMVPLSSKNTIQTDSTILTPNEKRPSSMGGCIAPFSPHPPMDDDKNSKSHPHPPQPTIGNTTLESSQGSGELKLSPVRRPKVVDKGRLFTKNKNS